MSTERAVSPYVGCASAASQPAVSKMAEHLVSMCAPGLFAGMSPEEGMEIASHARARTFMCNELLFSQGQPVRSLILLESGVVKMTQLSTDGSEVLLWMRGPGEPVNVCAASDLCNHTCSAQAMERCRTLVWDCQRLQALANRYPRLRMNILRIVTERLVELEERFREMATETVTKRLALNLLRLAKRVGTHSKEGIEVSLSRAELAQMTGTTLFTISRVLSSWAERGFVQPRREAVLVSDLDKLQLVSFQGSEYRRIASRLPEQPLTTSTQ
jgi:CRP/FNR family transcriptional regulator, nitrogen oxide reductase regulator